MTAGKLAGILGALVLLAGRWTFGRLSDAGESETFIAQPRLWIVVALVTVVMLQLVRHGTRSRLRLEWSDGWLLLLLTYLVISVTWAPGAELTSYKALEVALEGTAVLMLALSRSLFPRENVENGFWTTLLVVGLLLAVLTILASATGRAITPGGGPITFGRNMGLMGMAAWRLAERKSMIYRLGAAHFLVLAILMVVMSGSRGALLAFAVAGSVLIVLARLTWLQKTLAVGVIALLASGVLSFTDAGRNASEVFQQRIIETTFHRHHLAGREDLWAESTELAAEKPFLGWGINGFRANSWNYPHNLFLEVTVEGGIVGLALLLLALGSWLWRWRKHRHATYAASVAAMTLAFVSAQTSGDLYDSRCLFLLLVMAAPMATLSPQKTAEQRRPRPSSWNTTNLVPSTALHS